MTIARSIAMSLVLCLAGGVTLAQDGDPIEQKPVDVAARFEQIKDRLPGPPAGYDEAAKANYGRGLRALLAKEEGDRLEAGVTAMLLFVHFAAGEADAAAACFVPNQRDAMRAAVTDAIKTEADAFEGFEVLRVNVYSVEEAREKWSGEPAASLPEDDLMVEVVMAIASQDEPERKRLTLTKTDQGWLAKN